MAIPSPAADLHLASLDYACRFGALPESGGKVTFSVPDPVHFTFSFETGSTQDASGITTITWDTSWFVQAQVEAGITTALAAISAAIAAMLGVTALAVEQTITIQRIWTTAPNVQGGGGGGVSSGRIVQVSTMPYTPS